MLKYGIIILKATNDGVNRMIQDKDYLSVKDVAEMLDTEAYVLRFYEKELNLDIKRNSKGHRVYTLEDVELFRKVQDMRERGLQLKAIESLVHHEGNIEALETYEQLSSISVVPQPQAVSSVKKQETSQIDITDADDEKVKQFSYLIKDMFKQALTEYNEETSIKLENTIKQEVQFAVDEKVAQMQEASIAKNEEYYRKLDETMREVQKIRKEMGESKDENKKEKNSFWSRLFKDKNQVAEL